MSIVRAGFLALTVALFGGSQASVGSVANAGASANLGTLEWTSTRRDGTCVTEKRVIDMDAYVRSGGVDMDAVGPPAINVVECGNASSTRIPAIDLPPPTVSFSPPSAPPDASTSDDPTIGQVTTVQGPFAGPDGDWYQTTNYRRTTHPLPDGSFAAPGPWSDPDVVRNRPSAALSGQAH